MLTVEEWRPFLEKWSAEWLSTDEEFPESVRRRAWLGADAATPKQIARLERRLGFALPPSYRAFLLTTNGWRKTTFCIGRLRPLEKVQWLNVEDPEAVEAWNVAGDEDDDFMSPDEYFAYDDRPIFNARHLEFCLVVGDPIRGDSATYLLNPAVVTEDGEWEA